jgi:PAS domain S-box-containing protein
MSIARYLPIRKLRRLVCKPSLWFILALLLLITISYYTEAIVYPKFLKQILTEINLDRHAFERIIYLAPVIWAGLVFGGIGAFATSLVALACMLPRVFLISLHPRDALLETIAVFIIANMIAVTLHFYRREKERRHQLESTQQKLQASEQRYRQLFENAHDFILLHNLNGNIIAANRAAERLTGYSVKELCKINIRKLLSRESLNLARRIKRKLLKSEPVEQPYEQCLIKKDGSQAFVQLATSVVFNEDKPIAFQHIARDITDQKRIQENLHFYLQQVTKAQEEERKRISHELHDDTIQDLVVLSRRLDTIASSDEKLPEDTRSDLEGLRGQVNSIIQSVRRLSQDLRPAALDRLGLLPALEWLASDVSKYSGINTEVSINGNERRLPEDVELMLFRITQEAMRNVWRHSQATKANIAVEFDQNQIRVSISDNGKGFELSKTINDLARYGKLGLAGMQERARLAGGTLTIQSEVGKGSSITVNIPA